MILKKEIFLIFKKIFKRLISDNISFVKSELDNYNESLMYREHTKILQKLQSVGENVKINGRIFISEPRCVIIGSNVHIGNNAYISSAGGLIIGDNTHISRNVTIYTVNHNYNGGALPYDKYLVPKPVYIGKNVWIGMNVSIIPGTRIEDGAIIQMGSVITEDVPQFAIIGNPKNSIMKYRNKDNYFYLEEKKTYGGVGGRLLGKNGQSSWPNIQKINNVENIFFIVSTGRSGTKALAGMLSTNPSVLCLHEKSNLLIRISSEFAYNEKSFQETQKELSDIYENSYIDKCSVYGESNQEFFNLIPILDRIFPKCKFIWLIRNAKDFIASAYPRGWYSEEELLLGNPGGTLEEQNYYYRLDGGKCDDYDLEKPWDKLTPFEKNCWYWDYVNSTIENDLLKIPESRWIRVKLEDIGDQILNVQKFLDVETSPIETIVLNQADYDRYTFDKWNPKEIEAFDDICRKNFSKWYLSNECQKNF